VLVDEIEWSVISFRFLVRGERSFARRLVVSFTPIPLSKCRLRELDLCGNETTETRRNKIFLAPQKYDRPHDHEKLPRPLLLLTFHHCETPKHHSTPYTCPCRLFP